MNLVAKEYVAAQDPEDPGVLILSRFAGAAYQLTDAVLVNPYSPDDISHAIRIALDMPLTERKARWKKLARGVKGENVTRWMKLYLRDLDALAPPESPASLQALRSASAAFPSPKKPCDCRRAAH